MTTYRVGQRVRIEWPDGSAVEGYLQKDACVVRYADRHYCDSVVAERDGATITVLSEPRPEEPTGLGAVVMVGERGRLRVRVQEGKWRDSSLNLYGWEQNPDPVVVLSEGWTSS